MSGSVLVHHVEIVAVTGRHRVVLTREAEDSTHVKGPTDDAGLLAECEGVVDVMLATCGVQGGEQFLAKHGGLE
jgi:hypothetical protein